MFCFHALKSSTLFNQIILNHLEAQGFSRLTPALLEVFAYLADEEPRSMSVLAQQLGVSRQAIHKSVKKLVEMEYVTLEIRPTNQKEKIVVLTLRGEDVVRRSLHVITQTEEAMSGFLGADAYQHYVQQQQRLTAFLEALYEEDTSPKD